ncbi:MAG: hypothetical protein ACERK6_09795, partial [Candidatus Aminicenantaceae bacterium]
VAILVALVGAGSLAYAKRKVNEIDRIRLANSEFAGSEDLSDGAPRNFFKRLADQGDLKCHSVDRQNAEPPAASHAPIRS